MLFKVFMKRKISCSGYGFTVKNFENDSRTSFRCFFIFIVIYEIFTCLICKIQNDTQLGM